MVRRNLIGTDEMTIEVAEEDVADLELQRLVLVVDQVEDMVVLMIGNVADLGAGHGVVLLVLQVEEPPLKVAL